MPSPNTLWTTEEAARWLSVSVRHMEHLRRDNRGPSYMRLGRTSIRYAPAAVARWAASFQVETSDSIQTPAAATATS